jgi:hypothetical protein
MLRDRLVQALNHHISRLDQGRNYIALFQLQFTNGTSCNQGCHLGIPYRHNHLCQKPLDTNTDDVTDQLIPAADPPVPITRLGCRFRTVLSDERLQSHLRDTMMTTWGQNRLQLASQNPLLDRRVTNANQAGCFARCEHIVHVWHKLQVNANF